MQCLSEIEASSSRVRIYKLEQEVNVMQDCQGRGRHLTVLPVEAFFVVLVLCLLRSYVKDCKGPETLRELVLIACAFIEPPDKVECKLGDVTLKLGLEWESWSGGETL